MAHLRGKSENEPILIDDADDGPVYRPAPRWPSVRGSAPHVKPKSHVHDLTLSDDERSKQSARREPLIDDDGFEEVQAGLAWTAAQSRRRSDNRTSEAVRNGSSGMEKECSSPGRVVPRTPSVKPDVLGHIAKLGEDEGPVASVEVEEHGSHTRHTPSKAKGLVSLRDGRLVLLTPETTKRTEPFDLDAAPSRFASSPGAQLPRPSWRQSLPIIPATSTRVHEQRQTNASWSEAPYPMAYPRADSLQNQAPAPAVPIQNAPIVSPSAPQPINPSSAYDARAFLSTPTPDATESAPAGRTIAQLAQLDRSSLNAPIGELPEHSREQTISSRVNKTSAVERVNVESSSAQRSDATSSMPAKAVKLQGSSAAKAPQKQKAIKSAGRPGDHGGSRLRPTIEQHTVGEAAHPQRLLQEPVARQNSEQRLQPSPRRDRSHETLTTGGATIGLNTTDRPRTSGVVVGPPSAVPPHGERIDPPPVRTNIEDRHATPIEAPSAQPSKTIPEALNADAGAEALSESSGLGMLQPSNGHVEDLDNPNSNCNGQASSEEAQLIDTDDLNAALLAVEHCLEQQLIDRHDSHANLTGSNMWRQRTCYERELRAQRHQRKGPACPALPEKYVQLISPFEGMSSIQIPFEKMSTNKGLRDISQEIFTTAKPKDIVIRSGWAAPATIFKSEAVSIPTFKEYVTLKNSILADNESTLLATPYFLDEDSESRMTLNELLPTRYEMKHDENALLDLRTEQCSFYKDSVESFLRKINISWDDILYWLLASDNTIKRINNASTGGSQFTSLLSERSGYHVEKFQRDGAKMAILFERETEKWQEFLSQLKEPSAQKLMLSATACAAVLKECNFSIWYLVEQSETVLKHVSGKTKGLVAGSGFTYRDMLCRVCHQHNCLFHGELREVPEDSWEPEPELETRPESENDKSQPRKVKNRVGHTDRKPAKHDLQSSNHHDEEEEENITRPAHIDEDSAIVKVINYKLPANPYASEACAGSEMIESKGSIPPDGKFNATWWQNNSYTHKWDYRKPFYPCSHEGDCEQAQCRCFRENINCEKSCECSRSCKRRFPGCGCASTPGKRICALKTCLCIKLARECDADVCGTCGATEILDPVNRYNEDLLPGRCCNVAIQRGVPRKTLLGHSEVHGFGLYIGEDIKKDDYIGEYTGETISVAEGERRSTIYTYQQTMYLFRLNTKQEVDATYMGNKLRFINNAHPKNTNCYSKNQFCNTVFRLALYASIDLKAGTELFFDYQYPKSNTAHYKEPNQSKGKVVAVKQAKRPKATSKSSSSPSYGSSASSNVGQPSERMLKALEKARKVKAAKRAAMLAEQSLQGSTSDRQTGRQQARKTASNEPNRRPPPRASQLRGRCIKTARRSDSRDGSTASDTPTEADENGAVSPDTQESQSAQAVPETDEEDDDFVPEETQEDVDNLDIFDIPASDEEGTLVDDSEDGVTQRNPGRRRRRMRETGGARPEAGRKRKRPIVSNSDDE